MGNGVVNDKLVLSAAAPEVGQLVRIRDRHWHTTEVLAGSLNGTELRRTSATPQHLVRLSSVDDDGLDAELEVIWELETDRAVLTQRTLPVPRADAFDDPDRLRSFLDAVRWGAVASADSKALQAPFRSGITIEGYQLDPVVRAIDMPRVNLLVADDVGLGKTIEAGLVVQELLLRHRARTVLVLCPPALRTKWQEEMRDKFGLGFEIIDSERVRRFRRERGVAANIFDHMPRAIVSFDWLKDGRPLRSLREWLPIDRNSYPRKIDLLIVDEVHQCAPSGEGIYATDSLRTQLLRTIAPHVEHRIFLSATPHNGYPNSYLALLELLDPQRFARGVAPDEQSLRRSVVRRMKSQIQADLAPGEARFPKRVVRAITVRYGDDEHKAHRALEAYSSSRFGGSAGGAGKAAADLTTLLLKKRMFSSPAAFASTLDVHLETLATRLRNAPTVDAETERLRGRFAELDTDFALDVDLDDATREALAEAARASGALDTDQQVLLAGLQRWAERARARPDAKAERLVKALERWCRPHKRGRDRAWNDERVIVFTEYRDTQRWLFQILTERGLGGDRLAMLYGGMDEDERERITREFQADPSLRPVRILLATDTASEGIDLQKHCRLMVHVEIPFNPNRLEQRNGRIDRHGQPAKEVRIYHFVGAGFTNETGSLEADLEFLSRAAKKVERIRDDLGDAGAVLAREVERAMLGRPATVDVSVPVRSTAKATLRRMEQGLRERLAILRAAIDRSIEDLRISPVAVEHVVRVALDLARQASLEPVTLQRSGGLPEARVFAVPPLTGSWAAAASGLYDTVRERQLPITFDQELAGSRDDVVLAHLGHRLVAQSLRLLRAEMWSSSAEARLSRVTGVLVADADLAEPSLVAHGRLVLVGRDGSRLHEEVFAGAGRIGGPGGFARYNVGDTARVQVARRSAPLPAHHRAEIARAWPRIASAVQAAVDVRGEERKTSQMRALTVRSESERAALRAVLLELQAAIERELSSARAGTSKQLPLFADLEDNEREQLHRDIRELERRVAEIPGEIERETGRLAERYENVRSFIFPAALEFLVPARFAQRDLALMGGAA
jgi:superfamily II DNA or RNA helicase